RFRSLDELFLFKNIDIFQSNGTGCWIPTKRAHMTKMSIRFRPFECFINIFSHSGSSERQISICNYFRHSYDIWLTTVLVRSKLFTCSPKTTNHFINDEQSSVPVANLTNTW